MQQLVPPLYLESLEFINLEFPDQISRFWPRRLAKQEEELVAISLYQKLPATEHRVLRAWDDTLLSPRAALVHLHRHPEAVKKLLTALQLRLPTYVPEPSFDTDFFDEWPTLRHDSASEVAALLRQHSEAVMEICNQAAPSIEPGDIGLVLEHLVDGGESVVGMPLLPLGNGNIVQFQDGSHPHVFASHTEHIIRLFGPDDIISDGIPGDVVQRLIDLPVNVGALDSKGIQDLLQRRCLEPIIPGVRMEIDGQKLKWHQDLLEWIASSDSPVLLEELASLPLIPTIDGRQLISLEHACDGTVWCRESSEDARIQPILLQLNITVVDLQTLPGPLRRSNKADVAGVLEILSQSRSNLSDLHKSVRVEDWARFAALIKSWLQPGSLSSVAINSKTHAALASLPLFSGQHGNTSIPFVSSSDLHMLPHPVDPVSLARYLPPHLTFAPFSAELSTILQKYDQSRIMSFDALFDKLNLQHRRLPESEDVSLRALLELFRNHHPRRYYQPLIPDGNRYLRVPNQLNDHTVELFSTCFHDRQHMFVHPAFRDLIDDFRRLGVHHEIRPAGMLKCIEAIDEDTRRGQDTRLRAAWLWDFINRDPSKMHEIAYTRVRGLRFIPRHIQRYQSDETLDTYASDLPSVNSPDDMCLPKHALILWTQRASFATPPRPVVEAIYPSLGAPTIDHVVDHLLVLATTVAAVRPASNAFFLEISQVYEWLQENLEDALDRLGQLSEEPIWLNIDGPEDVWTWRPAARLVFDALWDGDDYYRARRSLETYKELIRSAGASQVIFPELPSPDVEHAPHPDWAMSECLRLRLAGLLCDVRFEAEEEEVLAHRVILAAVIPYFATAFAGDFAEGGLTAGPANIPTYPLPEDTLIISVRSVVDYAYTGQFVFDIPDTPDGATIGLERLLDLIKLCNFWMIDELKGKIVRAIAERQLVNQENWNAVHEHAVTWNAEDLAHYAEGAAAMNGWT
ncbi:hypothetical protein FRC04_009214 [Tulasnella sp. 424]|nr:hypothetical protein FRC04_009214 [Tulasnella sp. 424]KAG8973568.1 hypothetical protein FRC05_008636 [Tulasnella sp. 425]